MKDVPWFVRTKTERGSRETALGSNCMEPKQRNVSRGVGAPSGWEHGRHVPQAGLVLLIPPVSVGTLATAQHTSSSGLPERASVWPLAEFLERA